MRHREYYQYLELNDGGVAVIFGNNLVNNCYELTRDEAELVTWIIDHFHHDMLILTNKTEYYEIIVKDELGIPYEELPDGYFFVEEPKLPDNK